MMTTIADRISIAQRRIVQTAQKCSRNPSEIKLLAVSKTKPASFIVEAYDAGQRLFGENYVQEGENKILQLTPQYPDIEWHFIGPLQSNKTKSVAEHFDWMHTVSRLKIAQRLSEQRPSHLPALNICIQVNVGNEQTKSGISCSEVMALAKAISILPNLRLRGLMAIPTATDNTAIQHAEFAALQNTFIQLQTSFPSVDTLSMGMSGDLDIAIEHGSTMVRIGSAIFGERD